MKLTLKSILAAVAMLAVSLLTSPAAKAQVDPNQAEMVDLLGRVQLMIYTVEEQISVIGNTPFLDGEADALIPVYYFIYDELYQPTFYNLWDVRDYANILSGPFFGEYLETSDLYYLGIVDILSCVDYWVDYEIGQPGVL